MGAAAIPPAAPDPTERRLIARARSGDAGAWEQVVRRHQERAFRAAFLVARSPAVAEEVTRDAFVRAYRSLATLRDDQSPAAWILRIVAGLARTTHREERTRSGWTQPLAAGGRGYGAVGPAAGVPPDDPRFGAPPLPPGAHGGGVAPVAVLEAELLLAAVDRLAEDDRVLVCGRSLLGLSDDEIAQMLGIPARSVAERRTSAIRRLRSRLEGTR